MPWKHVSTCFRNLTPECTYLAPTDNALILIIAKATFVADADKSCGSNVGITDRAFAIAFVTETADSYARLLAAHNQVSAEETRVSTSYHAILHSTQFYVWVDGEVRLKDSRMMAGHSEVAFLEIWKE